MSKETFDTIGNQKKTNYALRSDMTEDEFVDAVLDGLSAPPQYFPFNVMMNKSENLNIDKIMERGSTALSYDDFMAFKEDGALVLDVRHQNDFTEAHIPGAIFIGLNGQFAPWVGALIKDIKQKIILIVPEGQEEEAAMRLARIGYDNSRGFLKGGIATWVANGNPTASITVEKNAVLEKALNDEKSQVIDVRKPGEYESSHITDVENRPLDVIMDQDFEWDADKTYYIHCAGGYRSVIFESILKSKGIHNFVDIAGGYGAIKINPNISHCETVCSNS
jgi:rhodanese-related sulfurtransferase